MGGRANGAIISSRIARLNYCAIGAAVVTAESYAVSRDSADSCVRKN